jgi:hypothetical protein
MPHFREEAYSPKCLEETDRKGYEQRSKQELGW